MPLTDWRLIDSGPGPGPWNLALDDAIFAAVLAGDAPPTLRLYAWNPPALSIGYGQDPRRDLDLEACRARGIAVLRRVTGGRAVLHDREVTYSVAVPAGLPPFGRSLGEASAAVASALVAALRSLGLAAARPEPAARRRAAGRGLRAASCFAVASGHEVVADGCKVVGSAQRRRAGALLQHGSILLAGHAPALAGLLRGAAGAGAMAGVEDLGGDGGYEAVAGAVVRGAREAWGARFRRCSPGGAERREARRLERERYGSRAWNAAVPGRDPGSR